MIADWCDEAADVIAPLLAGECRAWKAQLGWHLAEDWAVLEPARQARWIPGWVARGARTGEVRGWAFAVDCVADAGRQRQVGALVADTCETTEALIDAVLAPPCPATVTVFLRETPASAAAAWCARGFAVQPYEYLQVSLDALGTDAGSHATCAPWADAVIPEAAALLQRAYAEQTGVRPFAPMGSSTEWREYVEGLIRRPGCGTFVPEASVVVRAGASLAAVALTTQVGPETAHLAQLAVTPEARRGGTARALVQAVGSMVRSTRGCRTLTLLVSAANTPATRLYRGLGFRPSGRFLAARRISVSRACSSGPRLRRAATGHAGTR